MMKIIERLGRLLADKAVMAPSIALITLMIIFVISLISSFIRN